MAKLRALLCAFVSVSVAVELPDGYKEIIDLATDLEVLIQENIQNIRTDRWELFAVTQQCFNKTQRYSEYIRNVTKIARQGIVEEKYKDLAKVECPIFEMFSEDVVTFCDYVTACIDDLIEKYYQNLVDIQTNYVSMKKNLTYFKSQATDVKRKIKIGILLENVTESHEGLKQLEKNVTLFINKLQKDTATKKEKYVSNIRALQLTAISCAVTPEIGVLGEEYIKNIKKQMENCAENNGFSIVDNDNTLHFQKLLPELI